MPQQFMDYQEEAEYHTSYSQQKLHPRSRHLPLAKMIVVSCIILLCLVFLVANILIAITPSQNSFVGNLAGWLFLSLFFILALVGLAMLFRYDWSHRAK